MSEAPTEEGKPRWWEEEGNSILFQDPSDENAAHPDVEAMRALLDEGPPEERAENFKNQGNKCIQQGPKYYRDALGFYTDAIDVKVEDPLKNSVYFSNRAHVNLLLGTEVSCNIANY